MDGYLFDREDDGRTRLERALAAERPEKGTEDEEGSR